MDSGGAAGIVLAGGRSSRMGENKALMLYRGQPLVEHMDGLLRACGCGDVHISGEVEGYAGIPDQVRYSGPAPAMADLLRRFREQYEKIIFVPVDMPLIEVKSLQHLVEHNASVHFKEYPFPVCLMTGDYGLPVSVRNLVASAAAQSLDLPAAWEKGMANINDKKEWEKLAS